jgi:hypothetical protein
MEAAAKRKPDRAQPQVKRRTEMGWPVGPTLKRRGGTGHCPIMEAAAKRKPDRAQPQVKRRTEMGWPVGPTLIKRRA